MTRLLTCVDVAALLTLDDCIQAVEQIFRDYGEGRVSSSGSMGAHVANGTIHVKTAAADVFAVKINANFPGNPKDHGLPTIQGVIVLIDAERGTPVGILDSTLITTSRTAAATAVAARHLACRGASTLAVIGCGIQGRAHCEALMRVRPVRRINLYDLDARSAEGLAAELRSRAGIEVHPCSSIDEAVADCEMIVACTPSRRAILDEHHQRPGLFIAGVGADNPEKHELAPALLAQSRVVPDILEQAETMGDLHHAIAAGVMTRNDIHGELSDVICGRVASRQSDDQVFIFDSTGTALEDVVVASLVLSRAIERDVGIEIAFR